MSIHSSYTFEEKICSHISGDILKICLKFNMGEQNYLNETAAQVIRQHNKQNKNATTNDALEQAYNFLNKNDIPSEITKEECLAGKAHPMVSVPKFWQPK